MLQAQLLGIRHFAVGREDLGRDVCGGGMASSFSQGCMCCGMGVAWVKVVGHRGHLCRWSSRGIASASVR